MSADLPSFSLRVKLAKPPHGVSDVIAAVRAMANGDEDLRKGLTLGMQQLTFQIAKERFTGKGPFPVAAKKLGVVSGRLRRDLHAEPVEAQGGSYRGRIGSAVEYFGAHELGFDGEVTVPAHRRKRHTLSEKEIAPTMSRGRSGIWHGRSDYIRGAQSRLEQSVRAHKRHLKIPMRAPLRTGIEEHSARILGAAVQHTLNRIFHIANLS